MKITKTVLQVQSVAKEIRIELHQKKARSKNLTKSSRLSSNRRNLRIYSKSVILVKHRESRQRLARKAIPLADGLS